MPLPPNRIGGQRTLNCVRRCPTFPPVWVVSSALAGLASGFGMGPGVSLPLCTAVTLFSLFFECRPLVVGVEVFLVVGCESWLILVWIVWLRGFVVVVSFRPVSASSLRPLLGF